MMILNYGGWIMKRLKVYRVKARGWTDWEEYYSIVVVAENEQRALEIAKKGNPWRWSPGVPEEFKETDEVFWEFSESQTPLEALEIDLKEEQVIESCRRTS